MTPLVTVIIPCYNQAGFLPQALESALSQTHPNLEIVIVNDGSTDDTSRIAYDYLSRVPQRIRLIEHPNQGQARSRHAALAVARGDFLVQLDADDLLEPEMMSVSLQAFAVDPALDVVIGDAWLIDAAGRRLRPWPQRRIVPWPEILRNNPYGALAAAMVRTAAVRQAGGLAVEGACGVEDWDLWARLARCGKKFASLGRPVACYRQSPASTSHKAARMLQATVELLDRCHVDDPRLSGLAVHPPLAGALYQELRNGKVFKSLGLALSLGPRTSSSANPSAHQSPSASPNSPSATPLGPRTSSSAAPTASKQPSASPENATPLGPRTSSSANATFNQSPSASPENATPLGARTPSSATTPSPANSSPATAKSLMPFSDEISEILAYLVPGALDVRFSSDQFLEGIHYGFFLKMEQALPSTLDSLAFLNTLEAALHAHSLSQHAPALRQAIQKTLANPLRKRSLLTRLKERFF